MCLPLILFPVGDYVPNSPKNENENDEISSGIGDDARGVAAGKNIRQQQQDNPQTVNVNVDLNTIYVFLTEMKMEIGFIKRDVADVKEKVKDVQADVTVAHEERTALIDQMDGIKKGQYPRWLQILMITMAAALIVLALLVLSKVR